MNQHIEKHLKRVKGLKSEATHEKRQTDLRNFNEWVGNLDRDVAELDHLDLEDYFIDQMNQGYAPETLGARFQSVKEFYAFLTTKLDLYEDSPFDDLKRSDYVNGNGSKKFDKNDISYLTAEEIDQLAENVPAPTLRNELLIRMLFQTGMRRGEVVNVDLDDIDRGNRSIDVYSSKTGESRTVFYQPSLDLLMDQWIDGGYRSSFPKAENIDSLFIGLKGKPREDWANIIVKEAAENADLQEVLYEDMNGAKRYKVTAHTLRHSHAVHALKSGIDIRNLQKHLGHADIERTTEYLQLIDDDVKEAYRQFGVTDD